VLLEDYYEKLDDDGKKYLKRIQESSELLAELMDDLLHLSRMTRADINVDKVNLSELAQKVVDELKKSEPRRKVEIIINPDMIVYGDRNMLDIMLENLIGNAWKYSRKTAKPKIEIGITENSGKQAYFVRDNGVGFDLVYVNKLFKPFQRLHVETEFAGNGIGLATVQRIVRRHGGQVWAEAKVGEGATFYFTLNLQKSP
jgi:light-regulated signal transduction histidine kinase (bacteriophytochrome)